MDLKQYVRQEKKEHVELISSVLRADKRSDVVDCRYYAGHDIEIVVIEYFGGHLEYINVTCNSLGAIHEEIIKQVYHHNATGLISDASRAEFLMQNIEMV